MDDHYYAVIMAGGGGTRLWPLSRQARPKQMLRLFGERTLFQMTIDRLEGVFQPDHILVVTTSSQATKLHQQFPQIPRNNFILEPEPRGTASVVGLAAIALRQRDPDPYTTMAVLTSDHFIRNVPYFRNLLEAACDMARDGYLATIGITPTIASIGYGYIQKGDWTGGYQGITGCRVTRFIEKPDAARAEAMLKSKDYFWNSGMFFWRVEHILKKFRLYMPDLAMGLERIDQAWNKSDRGEVMESVWSRLHPQTIDYGIMEKATDVAMLPAVNLGWSDIGSWESLFEVLLPDDDGNIALLNAKHIAIDTKNTLVCSEQARRTIVTLGARNMIVVDTGDVLLVCPIEEAQDIKKFQDILKEQGREDLL